MSDTGHLSNENSAKLFASLMGNKTKKVILFHLSNECNTKELAQLSYESYFRKMNISLDGIELIVSKRNEPTDMIEV